MEEFGPLYRPPSEGKHPIVRITAGCAYNLCTFCSMYKEVPFRIRTETAVLKDIESLAHAFPYARRVFFADGDALTVPTEQLLNYITYAKQKFSNLDRVAAYATVQDILRKEPEELAALYDAGLTLLYIGLESGDNRILKRIRKGITKNTFIRAGQKAKAAGMALSVTLISGLAQENERESAAYESADAISQVKPDYLSWLTLYLEPSAPLFDKWQDGKFTLPTPEESLIEIGAFLSKVNAEGCVFRANHASNYVPLRGTLNRDRQALLKHIDRALKNHDYRPEWARRL